MKQKTKRGGRHMEKSNASIKSIYKRHLNSASEKNTNWARELSNGVLDLKQMQVSFGGGLAAANPEDMVRAKELFDFRVPQSFFKLLQEQDNSIAHQVIPTPEELNFAQEEAEDPIGDEAFSPVEGITHRYPDRVLLKPTYNCAVYCRFCFRRYKVSDSSANPSWGVLEEALGYIKSHPEIREVILTGGDPLVLTDKRLKKICDALSNIPHVKMIRCHTRIPTVLPSRVNESLIRTLKSTKKAIWVVAHINSPSELQEEARSAIGRLVDSGVPVLSQSVLLKGVNADLQTLLKLFNELVELRVQPYYLHYPDLARGTNHFRIDLEKAVKLHSQLQGKLPGYAIPKLILDIPGGMGKIPVEKKWAKQLSPLTWELTSPLTEEQVSVTYPKTDADTPYSN